MNCDGKHPCFSAGAQHKYARIHLPVAPKCNISCNYCSRKYDCLHESRPGVTSAVLGPTEAYLKFLAVREKVDNLSVVGIAGPGDALANWQEVSRTVQLIKEDDPEVLFCISTNGLLLPEYAAEILALGIKHVTVTLNTLNPATGARLYKYVNYQGERYTGISGAKLLLHNQLAGIEHLAGNGALLKINIVMVKGVNEAEIPEIVKKAGELGAFMTNIMPMIPAKGSVFADYPQTNAKELNGMRKTCEPYLRQMYHCRQCRADAIGLLGEDRSIEFSGTACNSGAACQTSDNAVTNPSQKRQFKIAVASKNGRLVDQHFGHASEFRIYQGDGEAFQLVDKRHVGQYCLGSEECDETEARKDMIISAIEDCDAVLTLRIGYHASRRLQKKGILSIEHYDTIANALSYTVQQLSMEAAVFVGETGDTVSIYDPGTIVVYRKIQGIWTVLREAAFSLDRSGGMAGLRRKMKDMLVFLDGCNVFTARSLVGIPYYELEKAGCSVWEFTGKPLEFLDYIIAKEEEDLHAQPARLNMIPEPIDLGAGCYQISLKDIQSRADGVTSKQVLLPFLQQGRFTALEILCNHIPPWLEAEFALGNLTRKVERNGAGEFKVIINQPEKRQGCGRNAENQKYE